MYFKLYTKYKENYISSLNLDYNLKILEENRRKLEKNLEEIKSLRLINPQIPDYAQILYDLELIAKKSAHYDDKNFIIKVFDYNEKQKTIKLEIR
jgi:hypothetical protein